MWRGGWEEEIVDCVEEDVAAEGGASRTAVSIEESIEGPITSEHALAQAAVAREKRKCVLHAPPPPLDAVDTAHSPS